MTPSETLELLVFGLEGTAQWRRNVQERYPDDESNVVPAEILERLAAELTSSPDLELVAELSKIESELMRQADANRAMIFLSCWRSAMITVGELVSRRFRVVQINISNS